MKYPERTVTVSFVILTCLIIIIGVFVNSQIKLGFADADNPAVMMALLSKHVHVYRSSGIVFVGMAVSLAFALSAMWEIYSPKPSHAARVGFLFCAFCTAFFLAFGLLRMQSTGTLRHLESINQEWAQAGYMVVQVAGTQGYISAAVVSFAFFMMCISFDNIKSRRFAIWLSWAGMAGPSFVLFMLFFGPFFPGLDNLFPVYIFSILLIFLWPTFFGISLLRRSRISKELST